MKSEFIYNYSMMVLMISVLISHDWFTATFVGNTFWMISAGYYVYINFLGYSCEYISIICQLKSNLI